MASSPTYKDLLALGAAAGAVESYLAGGGIIDVKSIVGGVAGAAVTGSILYQVIPSIASIDNAAFTKGAAEFAVYGTVAGLGASYAAGRPLALVSLAAGAAVGVVYSYVSTAMANKSS